jgi:serine/threonine protein kinase
LSPARRERFAADNARSRSSIIPLIARLYDAGTLPDGTPWFVMEYVEGAPLTSYCRTHALDVRQRLPCFAPSARRCSTPTGISSCTATSSRRTSSSPPTVE